MYDTMGTLFIGILTGLMLCSMIDRWAVRDAKRQLQTKKPLIIRSK